jgi:hypothetical protein
MGHPLPFACNIHLMALPVLETVQTRRVLNNDMMPASQQVCIQMLP